MDDPSPQKYIICLPRGGFNDIISVVWKCHEYARTRGRVLVMDSRDSFLKDDLRAYFSVHSVHVYQGDLLSFYNKRFQDIFPSFFEGEGKKLNSDVKPGFRQDLRGYAYQNQSTNISLTKDYTHQLVVYCNCGGGVFMAPFLRMCRLTDLLRNAFQERRRQLPASYTGVHIRNTDRTSNVETFLRSRLHRLKHVPVFLASDNSKTIDRVRDQLQKQHCQVFTFADIPPFQGKCIHYHHTTIPTREFNLDLMVDFLLLVHSKDYFFSCPNSGYSLAVQQVRQNIQNIQNMNLT